MAEIAVVLSKSVSYVMRAAESAASAAAGPSEIDDVAYVTAGEGSATSRREWYYSNSYARETSSGDADGSGKTRGISSRWASVCHEKDASERS